MGNRPKPTKLKMLLGNPGHQNLKKKISTEPIPNFGIPAMPKWLGDFPLSVEAWERDTEILDGMGVMTQADGAALAQRCYLEHLLIQLALRKDEKNLAMHKNLMTEYRMIGSLFGFDPASRTKLSVTDKGKKSKFDGLIGMYGGKK